MWFFVDDNIGLQHPRHINFVDDNIVLQHPKAGACLELKRIQVLGQ